MNTIKHDEEQANTNSNKLSSLMYLFLLAFGLITLLAACNMSDNESSHVHTVGSEIWETTESQDQLPQFLDQHTELTQTLYSQVHDHVHVLGELPCHCGCMVATEMDEAHDSLRRCYLAEYPSDDGTVTWTDHSTTCGVCKQEMELVIQMDNDGKSVEEIKQAINEKFMH